MTDNDILSDVTATLASVAGVDATDVTADKSIRDDLDLDSMTMVEAVVALEDRFGLLISDETWPGLVTVGDIVTYLEQAGVGVES